MESANEFNYKGCVNEWCQQQFGDNDAIVTEFAKQLKDSPKWQVELYVKQMSFARATGGPSSTKTKAYQDACRKICLFLVAKGFMEAKLLPEEDAPEGLPAEKLLTPASLEKQQSGKECWILRLDRELPIVYLSLAEANGNRNWTASVSMERARLVATDGGTGKAEPVLAFLRQQKMPVTAVQIALALSSHFPDKSRVNKLLYALLELELVRMDASGGALKWFI